MLSQVSYLILLHAGVMSIGVLATVPPAVWEVLCLSKPEADVPSEDTKEVSLSLPPSPSALAWQWLKAPKLDTSSDILSSVDMFMGPCRRGQSGILRTQRGGGKSKSDACCRNVVLRLTDGRIQVFLQ